METNKYLTAKELAALTGVSVATIWRLKGEGKIGFLQPGGQGSRVLFKHDAFEQGQNSMAMSSSQQKTKSLPGPKPNWRKK